MIGTGGRTRVTAPTLRARFGLYDTWAYFTSIATSARRAAGTASAAGPRPIATVSGTVVPARRGAEVQIQIRAGDGWKTVTSTIVRSGGAYTAGVAQAGTYRAVFSGASGPGVTID